MPAPEDTILEDPRTPAPIFAWRAFKGVFVGSPTSPEPRSQQIQQYDEDKENISPVSPLKLASPSKLSTPLKRKRDNANAEVQGQVQTGLVSPTKSILRTPGAMTPRMMALREGREARVTFRSVSLSPEVRRKLNKQSQAQSQPQVQTKDVLVARDEHVQAEQKQQVASKRVKQAVEPVKTQSMPQNSAKEADKAPSAADPEIMIDIEAHDRRTAKEMRRLIRHSQKWRDAAKRLDEENAKLKVMLEEARRENTRLEGALRRANQGQQQPELSRERGAVKESMSLRPVRSERAIGRETIRGKEKKAKDVDGQEAEDDAEAKAMKEIEELLDLTPPLDDHDSHSHSLPHSRPEVPQMTAIEANRSTSAPTPSYLHTYTLARAKTSTSTTLPRRPASSTLPTTSTTRTSIPATTTPQAQPKSHAQPQNQLRPQSEMPHQIQSRQRITPQAQAQTHTENQPNPFKPQQPQNPQNKLRSHPHPHPTFLPPSSTTKPAPSPLTALQYRIEGSILPAAETAVRIGMDEGRVLEVRRRLMERKIRRGGISLAASAQAGVGGAGVGSAAVAGGTSRWLEPPVGGKIREDSDVDWIGV